VRFWALLVVLATLAFAGASLDEAGSGNPDRAPRAAGVDAELPGMHALLRPAAGAEMRRVAGARKLPPRVLRTSHVVDVPAAHRLHAAGRARSLHADWRPALPPARARTQSMVFLN
jgi:hypothetical protein